MDSQRRKKERRKKKEERRKKKKEKRKKSIEREELNDSFELLFSCFKAFIDVYICAKCLPVSVYNVSSLCHCGTQQWDNWLESEQSSVTPPKSSISGDQLLSFSHVVFFKQRPKDIRTT